MINGLLFFTLSLGSVTIHTALLMLLVALALTQYVRSLTPPVFGAGSAFELLGIVFIGLILGFFLSLPLLFVPYKLLMKLAVYLREKRGWTELTHPRKIFVWALITFYGPLILLYYFFKYAS